MLKLVKAYDSTETYIIPLNVLMAVQNSQILAEICEALCTLRISCYYKFKRNFWGMINILIFRHKIIWKTEEQLHDIRIFSIPFISRYTNWSIYLTIRLSIELDIFFHISMSSFVHLFSIFVFSSFLICSFIFLVTILLNCNSFSYIDIYNI